MTRALVAMAVVVGLGAGSALSAPPTATVQALVWERNTLSLATLDARTLVQRGRLLELGRARGGVLTDQLDDRLAVASEGAGIVVIDTQRSKILWRFQRGRSVRAVAWLSPSRLLVAEHGSVLLLDPRRHRLVSSVSYDGDVIGSARWRGGLVMLAQQSRYSLGPARLIVVGPGLRVRTVELARIAAGLDGGEDNRGPFRLAQPGLGVSRTAGRAYVAGGMDIVDVDLVTLRVEYRSAERTEQKAISGPRRVVAALGDGVFAIAGADRVAHDDGSSSSIPFGLRLVRPASVRLVDEFVTDVAVAGSTMFGVGYRTVDGRSAAMGLTAYDRNGMVKWRLFGDAPVGLPTVVNGRAYVFDRGMAYAVDVASGSILGESGPWEDLRVVG